MGIFKKLGWYFREEKGRYLWGLLFLILVAVVNLIPPRAIGVLVDLMAKHKLDGSTLLLWLGLLVLAGVGQYVFRFGWRTAIWGGAAKLEKTLRSRLFKHFMDMDAIFYQKHRTGDLMAHATNDLNAIQNVAGAGILTLFDSIITGGTTIVAMAIFVDWRLTLAALIPMPLLTVMARKLGTSLHTAFAKSQAAFSRLNDKTQESISGIKVIKTFGQEKEDTADFNRLVDKTITINTKVNRLDALFDPITGLIMGLTYVIALVYGGVLVENKSITIGQLISFIAYVSALVWPMFAIGRLFNILERGNASYDRVNELLQTKSARYLPDTPVETAAHGDLSYQVRSFSYPEADVEALHDIDFTLPEGQTLGVVGRVGAGKTTLFKLLLREFDQYKGHITLGGVDIRDYQEDALLHAIGYVPQDNFLFSTTVANNIRFADFGADQVSVERAAVDSAVHDDILQFPDQYETLVGEKGVSLSGGQKQRLAIARALLTKPELLILDDALSAVDAKTETAILDALKTTRENKTTIIAAHRLSSVMHANEIVVLENGRIIERGTHDELLNQNGWYAEMWAKQELEAQLGGGANG
ncbi:ABC transporter ATP-binding protein [Lacticaseibacillus saniviri]